MTPQSQGQNPANQNPNTQATVGQPSPFREWLRLHLDKLKHVGLHEWLMVAATAAIALSTVLYTYYARGQLDTMQKTLNEMRSSGNVTTDQTWRAIDNMNWLAKTMDGSLKESRGMLEQAQKQTVISRQQLIGSQRAVIAFSVGFNGGPSELGVSLQNDGHITAKNVQVKISASKGELPSGVPTGAPLSFTASVPAIFPATGFHKQWLLPWQHPQLGIGSPKEWPKGWPGTFTYIFRGEYSYDNGFEETIRQSFCEAWLPRFTIIYKQRGSGGGVAW